MSGGKREAYHAGRNFWIFHGDALEIMAGVREDSVDMVFADPPYNLSNGGFTCHAGKRASVDKGKWDESRGVEEDYAFHYDWIAACRRVLKPNGALWVSGTYHSIYACGFALQRQGWHLLNEICWYKPNAAPHLACRMFAASHETLIWARKTREAKHTFHYALMKKTAWAGDLIKKPDRQMRSVWAINTPRSEEKKYGKHPTQKPEALLERIVLACTNENEVVLDPFCGSATTGVAALRNGRRFIGIDAEEEYLSKIAVPRLDDAMRQQSLPMITTAFI